MKMNKRGYMKTVEAVLALVIVLGVIITVATTTQTDTETTPKEIKIAQSTVNSYLQSNEKARNYVINDQTLLLNSTLDRLFSGYNNLIYAYELCDTSYCPGLSGLPNDRSIYVSHLIISSTYETQEHKVFKMYIWRKIE